MFRLRHGHVSPIRYRRWCRSACCLSTAVASVFAAVALNAGAATQWWDASKSSGLQAGDGDWANSNAATARRWQTSSSPGTANPARWTQHNDAVFSTSGTSSVTVIGTDVFVHAITFDGSGYTITGATGTELNLTGPDITTNADAIIGVTLDGTVGLQKWGSSTLILSGTNVYLGDTTIRAGTLQIGNGGTTGNISANSINVGISSGAVLSFNRSDSMTVNQKIVGGGSLSQIGSGTTRLSGGANGYTGGTTVTAGTLLADNTSGSATGSGTVLVNGTGTLGGTGTISGAVTVASGGTLNPGPSGASGSAAAVDTLHSGALTLQSGSFSNFDVATPTNFDKLISSSTLNLGGALDVNIAAGQTFTAGQTLTLFSGTSESGTFVGIVDGQIVFYVGYAFIADYTTTGFNLVAIPEPSAWFAAALALGAIVFTQRKRVRVYASSAVKSILNF